MEKRKVGWLFIVAGVFLAGSVAAIGAVVKHEPNFYREAQLPPGSLRTESATMFVSSLSQMVADRKTRPEWSCSLTQTQINSFLDETFVQWGEAESLRKLGVHSPNVVLEDDKIRLAFRYGSGWFSTVISYELKIWLVPKETNVIAIEVLNSRAGALPITSHTVINQLSEFLRKHNFKVTLYRHERNMVVVVDLENDQPHAAHPLTALTVKSEGLLIAGRTVEHALAAVPMMEFPRQPPP